MSDGKESKGMTFLKKLGSFLSKGLVIGEKLAGLEPFFQPLLGTGKVAQVVTTGVNDLTAIAQLTTQVETIGQIAGLSGQQKLQALVPLVKNLVQTSELVSGKKVADEEIFEKGCTEIAQGMVDVLQGLHPDAVPDHA